jgi:hypothetical protein
LTLNKITFFEFTGHVRAETFVLDGKYHSRHLEF